MKTISRVFAFVSALGLWHAAAFAQVLVSDWDGDRIVFFDIPTGRSAIYAQLPAGSTPRTVVADTNGDLYVSLRNGGQNVIKLTRDGSSWVTTNFTPSIGSFGPGHMGFDSQGNLVVAGDSARRVYRYNTATGALIDSFTRTGGHNLVGLAVKGDKVYACQIFQDVVDEFDLTQNPVSSRALIADPGRLERPVGMTIGAHGRTILVSSSATHFIQEYNVATGAFLRTFADLSEIGLGGTGDIKYLPAYDRYYTSQGDKLYEYASDGTFLRTMQSPHLTSGTGVGIIPGPDPDQTINFPVIPDKTFGDPDFDLTATATSGLAVEYTIVSGPATVTGSTVSITGTGTVTVRADQPGNAEYGPAPPVERSFAVAKIPATVTFSNLGHLYDGTPKSATAQSDPPGLGINITYSGSPDPPVAGGNHPVLAVIDDPHYAGSASGVLMIARATQVITFDPLPDAAFGDPPIELGATASSGLGVSFIVLSGPASVDGTTLTLTGAGDVTVRATQPGNGNYEPASSVDRTFSVVPGEQTISFPAIAAKTFGDAPFSPAASASSSLPVSFEVVSGPATSSGTQVSLTGAGDVTLRAKQGGNANWNPAPDVEQTFPVNQSGQVIAFPPLADRPFDGAPFLLAAASDSSLPVSFSIVDGPATIAGETLTMTGAGTITVRASQAGNGDYLAAADVERSFVAGFSLTLNPTTGGSIVADPQKVVFSPNETVTLSAVEEPNHRFTGWGDALTGTTSPADLVMDSHRTVSAVFKRIWSLNVSGGPGGTVAVDPDQPEYLDGDVVTLMPVPDAGYALQEWQGDASGSDDPLVITMSADTTIVGQFADAEPPAITIFSPADGVTNNQFSALFGTVADNVSVAELRWERDGAEQGTLEVLGGTFNVTGLVLAPGDNVFKVIGLDGEGNEGTAEVTVRWEPDRVLGLGAVPETREGNLVEIPISLESSGQVGGMTFDLSYDAAYLTEPSVTLIGAASQGIVQVNVDTPGSVRITFALPATTLPSGSLDLGNVTFRARSVPFDLTAPLDLTVLDVAGADGNQISFGTHTVGGEVRILQREHTGDINTNGRLDTGDAFRMQRLLTGLDEIRLWDHVLNDLNGSSLLDSGDVIRVLRTIVGLDPQPGEPGPSPGKAPPEKGGAPPPAGPRAVLVADRNYGFDGDEITVQVILEDPGYAPGGASFRLDYPPEALRLTDATSHYPGEIVSNGSLVLWNVAPSQNDYANQTGSVAFVASSAVPWPGSENGGVLAEFVFEVQAGAADRATWPLHLRAVELPSDDGFEVLSLPDDQLHFIGRPLTYVSWLATVFDPAELGDPLIVGPDSDPDGDGITNLGEYGAGFDPKVADRRGVATVALVEVDGREHIAIEFPRLLAAIDVTHHVQLSSDLIDWTENGAGQGEMCTTIFDRKPAADGVTETVVVRALQSLAEDPPEASVFLRVVVRVGGP